MKRITIVYGFTGAAFNPDEVKAELESVLLRLHPRVTYKIGKVSTNSVGKVNAEIAFDGKRKQLDQALRVYRWRLPVSVESIGWGWFSDRGDEPSPVVQISTFEIDPLAQVIAIDGVRDFSISSYRLWLRFLLLVVTSVVLAILVLENIVNKYSLALELGYIIVFFIWLVALNETPLDVRVYAKKVVCGEEALEVMYWSKTVPSRIEWKEIWGVDLSDPVCTLYSSALKCHFLLSERMGCPDQKIILKTIITRSDLNYVEGNYRRFIYRRYESVEDT